MGSVLNEYIEKCETPNRHVSVNQGVTMMKELNKFRKAGLFCDYTITLPDQSSYSVHKNIMAAGCPFFKGKFNFEDGDKKAFKEDISGRIFEKIIEFIYTGETEIELEDALILLENAEFFQLDALKNILSTNILIKNININTCLIYWRYGELYDKNLKEQCQKFIIQNVLGFLNEYLNDFTYQELNEILSLEKLNCAENELYLFAIKWLKGDYENRKDNFSDLLKNLRICSISDSDKVKLIAECCGFDNLIISLSQHLNVYFKNEHPNKFIDKIFAPRIGSRTNNLFGVNTSGIVKIDKFNVRELLKIVVPVGYKIHNFAENYLLICGGENSASCQYFCPIQNNIKAFPQMIEMRSKHGIVSVNDIIYVGGGCNNGKTTEKYDLNVGTWIKGPDLTNARHNYDLTSWNNCIYAFGGGSNIIEKLDPRESNWTPLKFDSSTNYDLGNFTRTLTIENTIYNFTSNKIHIFDVRQEKWFETINIDSLNIMNIVYFNNNINFTATSTNGYYHFYKYDIYTKKYIDEFQCSYNNTTFFRYSLVSLYD